MTSHEIGLAAAFVDRARSDGRRIVTVPDALRRKLAGVLDIDGNPMVDLKRYELQWNESFSFDFVDQDDLTPDERTVFARTDEIIALRGERPAALRAVRISTTMRLNATGSDEVVGLWDGRSGEVVIRRDQLADIARYAGALLHEVTHAASGAQDVTVGFEDALTNTVGVVATDALRSGRPANEE